MGHIKDDTEAGVSEPKPMYTSFDSRLGLAGTKHIFWTKDNASWVNLVALQRMNLHVLQKELLDEAQIIIRSERMGEAAAKNVRHLLHEYCVALRDREYMRNSAKVGDQQNPFMLSSTSTPAKKLPEHLETTLVMEMEAKLKDAGIFPENVLTPEKALDLPELPGGPWDNVYTGKERFEAFMTRYLTAILGGIMLIGPMILMVLIKKRKVLARLLTVGFCTMAFALVLAFPSSTDKLPLELLSATAAYTAVLVVFVGTTS